MGTLVGRGFADLGEEEFVVLTGERLLSLYTGTVTLLNDVRREHLFSILSIDQMIAEMRSRGCGIERIECIEQRRWRCGVRNEKSNEIVSAESVSLEESILLVMMQLYGISPEDGVRCLKTEMVNA